MIRTLFKFKYSFQIYLAVISVLFVLPCSARASTVFFSSEQEFPVAIDSQFRITVMLDTEGRSVNAIEGEFVYDDEHMEVVSISDGSSIVTSWVERPNVNGSSINFSGIMAGGFGETINPLTEERLSGEVFSVEFRATNVSKTQLYFTRGQVYLNDGFGTQDMVSLYPFEISITTDGNVGVGSIIDTERPLVFYPEVSTNQYIYDGKYFLIFSTTDKESGINHFEVKEGRNDWKIAESPYLLEDQSLRSFVRVKAVDNAGNIRIAQVHTEQFFPVSIFLIPIAIIALILTVVLVYFPRKFKKIKVQ